MFSGIIESIGKVEDIQESGSNKRFKISCSFTDELKVDQSVSHNGVCLTVESIESDGFWVSAIEETLVKSNLGDLTAGALINLERSMQMNGRLDGHIVQGHVDDTAECLQILEKKGSWEFTFGIPVESSNLLVEKGSVCLNGISLTVFDVQDDSFKVAIIPYTYEHTNIQKIKVGDNVNIEYDIIGKYVVRFLKN